MREMRWGRAFDWGLMRLRIPMFILGAMAILPVAPAWAEDGPWSVTLYGGPSTTKWVTQILGGGFEVNGAMIGLAVDRGLFKLGSGISFAAEVQATQYGFGYTYGTGAVGLGFRFDEFPWSDTLPTSFAVYTGPSYASDPPLERFPWRHHPPKFLNYVGIELSVPFARKWDAALRVYHRSGAWGAYSNSADLGSTIGIGIRRRF